MAYSPNPSPFDKACFEAHLFSKLGNVQDIKSFADPDLVSESSADQEFFSCSTDLEAKPLGDLEKLFPKLPNSRRYFSPVPTLPDPDRRFRSRRPRLFGLEMIPGNPAGSRYYNERDECVFEGMGLMEPRRTAFELARDKISAKDWKRKVEDREGDWNSDDWRKKKEELREMVDRIVAKAKFLAMRPRQARGVYGYAQGTE
jgi:hypothetical protein